LAKELRRKSSLIRLLTTVLLVMLFSWPGPIPGTPAAAESPDEATCFLWEVDGKTGQAYLLGSVHLGTDHLFPLPPKIEEAYEKSSFLAVEINLLAVEEEELFSITQAFAINPAFQGIWHYISTEEYKMLQEALAEFDINIEQVSFFRPWYLANTVTMSKFIKAGFDPGLGIDLYFMQKASGKKDILELESAEFQYRLFSELPSELERLYLRDALTTGVEEIAEETNRLLEAWKTGDTGLLEEVLLSYKDKDTAHYRLYERLVIQRNRGMVEKIEEYMGQGTPFIVIGAAHMVGDDGIVELLRQRGYTVRQL